MEVMQLLEQVKSFGQNGQSNLHLVKKKKSIGLNSKKSKTNLWKKPKRIWFLRKEHHMYAKVLMV